MSVASPLKRLAEAPRSPVLQISVYYLLAAALVGVAWTASPAVREYFASGALSNLPEAQSVDLIAVVPKPDHSRLEFATSLLGSLLAGLLLMIPTSWAYMASRPKYRKAIVRTMIVLPIVVAGIVTIVQHSLALAFSLAGIVAGVRFRTTLKNTLDALFIFAAIGVGLAVGIGAWEIAAVVTIVFNYVILFLTRSSFGVEASESNAEKASAK